MAALLCVFDVYLAGFHAFQRAAVAFRRNAGAAGRVDKNRYLGQKGFDKQRVGNDADVGAHPYKLDAFNRVAALMLPEFTILLFLCKSPFQSPQRFDQFGSIPLPEK